MFLGQYEHTLDDKGRLTIPAAFRNTLEDGAYISQGFDRNLMIMSTAYFQAVYERVMAMNIADSTARLLRRLLLSSAYKVDVDKAGRILLPQKLRKFLRDNNDTILVGQGEYFEIWSPSDWDLQANALEDTEANAQRFAMLDLSTVD